MSIEEGPIPVENYVAIFSVLPSASGKVGVCLRRKVWNRWVRADTKVRPHLGCGFAVAAGAVRPAGQIPVVSEERREARSTSYLKN